MMFQKNYTVFKESWLCKRESQNHAVSVNMF